MHAATSKVENSAQGLSCKLKFVHGHKYCTQPEASEIDKHTCLLSKLGSFIAQAKNLVVYFEEQKELKLQIIWGCKKVSCHLCKMWHSFTSLSL